MTTPDSHRVERSVRLARKGIFVARRLCHDAQMLGCTACGFDWDPPEDQLAAAIGRFGTLYLDQIERIRVTGGEAMLHRRPVPGVWSPLEYVAHMRDVVGFYLDRIERVLTEDRPQLTGVGFSDLAESRRYRDDNVDDVLAALDAAASVAATRLGSLEPSQWSRVGIGTDGDDRTVLVLARRLAHEGHHHLLDIAPDGSA